MIDTVLFDMGGTLEDIWYNSETTASVTQKLIETLQQHGLYPGCNEVTFWNVINAGVARYKTWSESRALEKKPEEIWPEYYLRDFGLDSAKVAEIAEELAGQWEITYYHRELRPDVKPTLDTLRQRGYKLGVISNTASLYSVFDVLEAYGIREYFQDVTLSSVTGYRKPHPSIFQIALRQIQSAPENCIYVGDTLSRDVIGAKQQNFGAAVQIRSFLSAQKDVGVDEKWKPDCVIENIAGVVDFLDRINGQDAVAAVRP